MKKNPLLQTHRLLPINQPENYERFCSIHNLPSQPQPIVQHHIQNLPNERRHSLTELINYAQYPLPTMKTAIFQEFPNRK